MSSTEEAVTEDGERVSNQNTEGNAHPASAFDGLRRGERSTPMDREQASNIQRRMGKTAAFTDYGGDW